MHSEWFSIPEDTIDAIKSLKSERESANTSLRSIRDDGSGRSEEPRNDGRDEAFRSECICDSRPRVVALGTTVARTLEYYAKTGKTSGEDDIFIYPGFEFKIVDALITNYHAPKSTVLMLASAFAGWDHLKHAYEHAIEEKYNFLSYGDSMLIC
ncbi:S-adenosylmethionine:tRNA ribosyltransferase-isomerase [Candidatus Saccharibacteria bacterium]|nr:S-adenosylmethionine:tRNA ribosyltransferase-isomerase [Candidatus Saccharibacteria bacterium]